MSEPVHIPETSDEVAGTLAVIDGVMSVNRWHRAAIIYAHTTKDDKGGGAPGARKNRPPGGAVSMREFASQHGMDEHTVAKYRNAWEEHGDPDIKPGDAVTLPEVPFPKGHRSRGTKGPVKDVIAGAEKITPKEARDIVAALQTTNPKAAKAVGRQVADKDDTVDAVFDELAERRKKKYDERKVKHTPERQAELDAVKEGAQSRILLDNVAQALRNSRYELRRALSMVQADRDLMIDLIHNPLFGELADYIGDELTVFRMAITSQSDWDKALAALPAIGEDEVSA